ncbi:MAG: guanylate kinase, partial [Bacteroidota bacterium]
MENGKLIIISAPSGSGKTTIIKRLLKQDFKLGFSVSATSRAKRKSEKDGTDYYFITAADFRKKIYNDEFLEWEEVYENIYYGTLKSEVERITGSGNNIIFDVDVVGASNIKKLYGERAFSLFIMPPSVEELRRR